MLLAAKQQQKQTYNNICEARGAQGKIRGVAIKKVKYNIFYNIFYISFRAISTLFCKLSQKKILLDELFFSSVPLLLLLLHFSLAPSRLHFFRVCLCMCASAKVIYCYKYLLVSFLSTFSLRFLWRTLVFFSVSVLYFSVLFVVLHFLFRHVCFSIHFQFTQFFVSA